MIAVCAYKTCSCANDYECEKYEHDIKKPHEHSTPSIFDKTLPSIVALCGGAGNLVENAGPMPDVPANHYTPQLIENTKLSMKPLSYFEGLCILKKGEE